ncbi:MAG: sulfotransferase, partial [Acidimicrobiales bacterium]
MSFDRDRMVADAITATGLDDLGEPTWQEGLDRLLESLTAEARLSDLGVTVIEAEVGAYLRNRL